MNAKVATTAYLGDPRKRNIVDGKGGLENDHEYTDKDLQKYQHIDPQVGGGRRREPTRLRVCTRAPRFVANPCTQDVQTTCPSRQRVRSSLPRAMRHWHSLLYLRSYV